MAFFMEFISILLVSKPGIVACNLFRPYPSPANKTNKDLLIVAMDLQIKGTVKKILEEQSGESKNGQWRKRDFILETGGQYPKKVCITQWGDNIDQANVQQGETITAHIDIQSREYKGNWYTDVKAWKLEKGNAGNGDHQMGAGGEESKKSGPPKPSEEIYDVDDELPF
jgi:hypothetical protein